MSLVERLTGFPFDGIHRGISRLFLARMDYVVAQSSREKEVLNRFLPHEKVAFVRGPYFAFPSAGNHESKAAAQKKVGVNGTVVLFFGFVRPYKGLNYLVEAFPAILRRVPDATLLIAGEFWAGKNELMEQIRALGISNHVRIVDSFVPANEVATYFSAADVCVVPYTTASQSAIIPQALAHGVPVVSTDVGGNRDWIRPGKNGELVPPRDAGALAKAIVTCVGKTTAMALRKNILKEGREPLWNKSTEKLILGMD